MIIPNRNKKLFTDSYGQLAFDANGIPTNAERRPPNRFGRQEYSNWLMNNLDNYLRVFASDKESRRFQNAPAYTGNVQEYLNQARTVDPELYRLATRPIEGWRLQQANFQNPQGNTPEAKAQLVDAQRQLWGWGAPQNQSQGLLGSAVGRGGFRW